MANTKKCSSCGTTRKKSDLHSEALTTHICTYTVILSDFRQLKIYATATWDRKDFFERFLKFWKLDKRYIFFFWQKKNRTTSQSTLVNITFFTGHNKIPVISSRKLSTVKSRLSSVVCCGWAVAYPGLIGHCEATTVTVRSDRYNQTLFDSLHQSWDGASLASRLPAWRDDASRRNSMKVLHPIYLTEWECSVAYKVSRAVRLWLSLGMPQAWRLSIAIALIRER